MKRQDESFQLLGSTCSERFDSAVREVSDPTSQPEPVRSVDNERSKEHALDAS